MVCENLFTVGEGGQWGFEAKQGKKKKKFPSPNKEAVGLFLVHIIL